VHTHTQKQGGSGTVAVVAVVAMTQREVTHFGARQLSAPRWRGRLRRGATWVAELHRARGGGLGGGLGDAQAWEPSGSTARVPWRQALGHGITVSAAAACSNVRGCLGPQSVAGSKGMRWRGMRQHWSDARVAVLPELHRRWGSAGSGEGIGENDPDM
jgi:hypothetical protein